MGWLTNVPLVAAVVATVVLQLAVIGMAPLRRVFQVTPLTVAELAVCVALSMLVLLAVELEKWRARHHAFPLTTPG
jgi:Ca2+-transporting ATPase